jgi:Tol biopolymer transport system component
VTRPGRGQAFGTPAPLTAVNSTDDEAQPYFTPGNQQIWFGRNGAIAMAVATSTGFATPTLVSELNTLGSQTFPVPSADGLYIYFASDRNGSGSASIDVFLARRASTTDQFGIPTTVAEVSSSVEDDPTWLSPDGCRLYISSMRSGTMEIYVASRSP